MKMGVTVSEKELVETVEVKLLHSAFSSHITDVILC